MEGNGLLQKVIVVHDIILVVVIIACEVLMILFQASMIPFLLLTAICPTILFTTVCVTSKCNWQNLCLLLVHFNLIFSSLWFIAVFPVFVNFLFMSASYDYMRQDVLPKVMTYITGLLGLSSAIFAVREISKYIQTVLLSAGSVEREPVGGVGRIQSPYETPVTFTHFNGI